MHSRLACAWRAQGNVNVLILNFEKLGMNRHQALDNLKVWFERLQVEGQQVEMEVEEEVGDKVLESRRSLKRKDQAMDILDDKENGVSILKRRVKQSIVRCSAQHHGLEYVLLCRGLAVGPLSRGAFAARGGVQT